MQTNSNQSKPIQTRTTWCDYQRFVGFRGTDRAGKYPCPDRVKILVESNLHLDDLDQCIFGKKCVLCSRLIDSTLWVCWPLDWFGGCPEKCLCNPPKAGAGCRLWTKVWLKFSFWRSGSKFVDKKEMHHNIRWDGDASYIYTTADADMGMVSLTNSCPCPTRRSLYFCISVFLWWSSVSPPR